MQKRLIIAVGISMLILVFFQQIQAPQAPVKEDTVSTESSEESAVDKKETKAVGNSTEKIDKKEDFKEKEIKKDVEVSKNFKTVEITKEGLSLKVNNVDAGLTSLLMEDKDGSMVELVRDDEFTNYPLSITAESLKSNSIGRWKVYRAGNGIIRAENSDGNIAVVREYSINDKGRISLRTSYKNVSGRIIEFDADTGWYGGLATTKDLKEDNYSKNRLFAKIDDDIKKELEEKSYSGNIDWAGIVNRYFMIAFIDLGDSYSSIGTLNVKDGGGGCSGKGESDFPGIVLKESKSLNPGQSYTNQMEIYAGLKEYKTLKELDEDMDEVLSFGIFGFLSRIFLAILLWFQSIVGNYGLAIIMLTFLLQIFIFPLTIKSFKSMQAMKELQPKMQDIREKYKDDAQRMNQEIMALYKKHGVNPFGGCFPLLLQMPIFISLFTMLRSVAELRFSTFLWINDLARQDVLFSSIPLIKDIPYIGGAGPLPLLMGAAMFLQQKVTGGTEGPQKNLTYIMPVVFTFLFMRFPSGLVLYWLTNSMLTFTVQSVIKKND